MSAQLDETLHGWGSEDGKLVPVWFTGEQVPENLYYDEATSDEDDSDDDEEMDGEDSDDN